MLLLFFFIIPSLQVASNERQVPNQNSIQISQQQQQQSSHLSHGIALLRHVSSPRCGGGKKTKLQDPSAHEDAEKWRSNWQKRTRASWSAAVTSRGLSTPTAAKAAQLEKWRLHNKSQTATDGIVVIALPKSFWKTTQWQAIVFFVNFECQLINIASIIYCDTEIHLYQSEVAKYLKLLGKCTDKCIPGKSSSTDFTPLFW